MLGFKDFLSCFLFEVIFEVPFLELEKLVFEAQHSDTLRVIKNV